MGAPGLAREKRSVRLYFHGTSDTMRLAREGARRRGHRIAETPDGALIFSDTRLEGEQCVCMGGLEPAAYEPYQAHAYRLEGGVRWAEHPTVIVVGMPHKSDLSHEYEEYLRSFDCPVIRCSVKDAMFVDIATNARLAAMVESTNRLAAAAEAFGAHWMVISRALRFDERIGKYSYLTPGDWKKSACLVRDMKLLEEIENARG